MNNYSAKVAIVGVTGYAGRELDRILGAQSHIRVCGRFASTADPVAGIDSFSPDALRRCGPDIVVLAIEHDLSLEAVPLLLAEGYRVLDMSGAYRLKNPDLYPQWYGFTHTSPELLETAVYGLPEFFSKEIAGARLVANPGCYATAAILPLLPVYRADAIAPDSSVVVDGKSGVSGAGRKPRLDTHFCEVSENIRAYGVLQHRHTPEMVSWLPGSTFDRFVFTPHLIPINRGILSTIVIRHRDRAVVSAILADTYAGSEYVKVFLNSAPSVQDVVRTNFCHIGVTSRGDTTVLVSAIDNLVKGAAGQAAQNLNLMIGRS